MSANPELGGALAALGDGAREPFTRENLAARQERDAAARPRPTLRDLRADGRVEVDELRVPGAPGGPDVTLVSARPAGPLPLLYYKSAGGGLAAALALLTRDRGGPAPIGQLLLCPMLDDRDATFFSHQMAGIDTWDRTSNATAWQALLGDRYGASDLSPYAAPARATDLSGLPPAYIEVGSAETFRDEDVAYANAIWQAGGQAELHVWPGAFHGFDTLAPRAALSQDARNARSRWLRRVLAQSAAHAVEAECPADLP
ncbi:alpha/beta hydrolase fold domain-containing protein [Streptomyces sp. ISL-43]|uniref:alpha/beta hydrolase fold domain-containing protein n=1 Tax=Streptomyces sp. ISL-43 TaxID=2819183 RepID=UPI001BE8CF88|nr:alpha/beta hydrolase fold domain-containing protein [Streptomyces sp. ISL-43]MBT2452343.1 alpha/beta hydrolase fold domain-containing protein [Streptomyces sp. ISL-43]